MDCKWAHAHKFVAKQNNIGSKTTAHRPQRKKQEWLDYTTKLPVSVLDNPFPDTNNTKRDDYVDYVVSMLNRHSC